MLNKSLMIKYNFWCFDCEIDEQIFDAIFAIRNIRFDVKIKRRENFNVLIKREIISIQNIDFFDVANCENISFNKITIFDVIEKLKNEIFEMNFAKLVNNMNINVDLFDKNVVNNVNVANDTMNIRFAIIVFNIKKSVDVANDVNIVIDTINVNFANSFAIFSNFFW